MKYQATFLVPNPMYPNHRVMGYEEIGFFATKQEARNFAAAKGYELLCIKEA